MLLRWLGELRHQGRITPVLIAPADTRLYEQSPQGMLSMPLSAKQGGGWFARIANTCVNGYRLARYVSRLKPELAIVAEGTVLASAWVTLLLRLLGIKTTIYVPLTQSGKEMGFGRGALRDWLVRKLYRHLPHAWITLSNEQASHFREWSGVNRPVFVLPNTVTAEIEQAVDHHEISSTTRLIHKPLRVLILGRLDAHQKNLDTLLNFLCFHVELSADFHFSFVGDGPFREQIEQRLCVFPALQKLVSLRPWSATSEVMREQDVLLLASRYEGVPLVMLEAMALGLPVIASNLPGTRALLKPDCLFATGDYEQAMRLLHSIKQDDRRMAVIRCNRELFIANASGAAFTRAVAALTDKLMTLAGSADHEQQNIAQVRVQSRAQSDGQSDAQPDDITVVRSL